LPSAFCTIITSDYLFYALALRDSLCRIDPAAHLHILVTDAPARHWQVPSRGHNLTIYQPDAICTDDVARALRAKYAGHAPDHFRWSMKPIFIKHLLRHGMRKAIYVDSDIFFFAQFAFLFDALDSVALLLSPHWRSADPRVDPDNFEKNFSEGLFNGGFVGATEHAGPMLDWWARCCLYKCVKDRERGLYDDQKYLDMMPVRFENVGVLRHRGCNVAEWNAAECKRTVDTTGQTTINGVDPIVFIHFTAWLYHRILHGDDGLLRPFMDQQIAALREYQPTFVIPQVGHPEDVGPLTRLRRVLRRRAGQDRL
jgi:hypothetical protein